MNIIYRIPGPLLVILGAFFLSFGGMLVKSFEEATLWQILLWRSIFFVLTISVFLILTYKKQTISKFKKAGVPGFVAGFFLSLGFVSYVYSMYNTTVANVNFTITTQTIWLALLGFIFLKEKISLRTLFAIILAMSGVLLMVGNSISEGNFMGNLVALVMPISFAILVIIIRKFPHVDMVPAMFFAGIFSIFFASIIVSSIFLSTYDIFLGFLCGVTQLGFGFICITIGSKTTPSATVGVLMLTEAILGPIWAWLFANENPPMIVLIGGFIVIFAVIIQFYSLTNTKVS